MNHRAEARQQLKEKIIEEEAAEKNKECCWNCHYMQWMVSLVCSLHAMERNLYVFTTRDGV